MKPQKAHTAILVLEPLHYSALKNVVAYDVFMKAPAHKTLAAMTIDECRETFVIGGYGRVL